MKTPDEIKKGMECRRQVNCPGDICPYYCEEDCIANMSGDAFNIVRQLEAQVPKWISVKERLPENEKTVLISATRKGVNGKCWHVVMTAFYTDGNLHTEDSSFAWDCEYAPLKYCEETDDYIIPEGWWEAVECGDEFSAVDLFVTHWMPLPEPPEGGSRKA